MAGSGIREIIILPDADDAGERYAAEVAECLAKMDPAPTMKVVNLPGLVFGEGGDMADFVELRGGAADWGGAMTSAGLTEHHAGEIALAEVETMLHH